MAIQLNDQINDEMKRVNSTLIAIFTLLRDSFLTWYKGTINYIGLYTDFGSCWNWGKAMFFNGKLGLQLPLPCLLYTSESRTWDIICLFSVYQESSYICPFVWDSTFSHYNITFFRHFLICCCLLQFYNLWSLSENDSNTSSYQLSLVISNSSSWFMKSSELSGIFLFMFVY